jgi:hypothetical protein
MSITNSQYLFNTYKVHPELKFLTDGYTIRLTQLSDSVALLEVIKDSTILSGELIPDTLQVYSVDMDNNTYRLPRINNGWVLCPTDNYKIYYKGENAWTLKSLKGWDWVYNHVL